MKIIRNKTVQKGKWCGAGYIKISEENQDLRSVRLKYIWFLKV